MLLLLHFSSPQSSIYMYMHVKYCAPKQKEMQMICDLWFVLCCVFFLLYTTQHAGNMQYVTNSIMPSVKFGKSACQCHGVGDNHGTMGPPWLLSPTCPQHIANMSALSSFRTNPGNMTQPTFIAKSIPYLLDTT